MGITTLKGVAPLLKALKNILSANLKSVSAFGHP
jgi:hypothetical protein